MSTSAVHNVTALNRNLASQKSTQVEQPCPHDITSGMVRTRAAMEHSIERIESLERFRKFDHHELPGNARIPDERTLCKYRKLKQEMRMRPGDGPPMGAFFESFLSGPEFETCRTMFVHIFWAYIEPAQAQFFAGLSRERAKSAIRAFGCGY